MTHDKPSKKIVPQKIVLSTREISTIFRRVAAILFFAHHPPLVGGARHLLSHSEPAFPESYSRSLPLLFWRGRIRLRKTTLTSFPPHRRRRRRRCHPSAYPWKFSLKFLVRSLSLRSTTNFHTRGENWLHKFFDEVTFDLFFLTLA